MYILQFCLHFGRLLNHYLLCRTGAEDFCHRTTAAEDTLEEQLSYKAVVGSQALQFLSGRRNILSLERNDGAADDELRERYRDIITSLVDKPAVSRQIYISSGQQLQWLQLGSENDQRHSLGSQTGMNKA